MHAILWVDDEPAFVEAHRPYLGELGAHLQWAPDGEAALALIRVQRFALVITDLQMPPGQWGGLWLIKALAGELLPPPVLVLSGRGTTSQAIEATRLGARNYVEKEMLEQELAAMSRETLVKEDRILAQEDYAIVAEIETALKQRVMALAERMARRLGLVDAFHGVLPEKVVVKALEEQRRHPEKALNECLYLIQYRAIITSLWQEIPEFQTLGALQGLPNKKDATKWLVDLNGYRNTVMHPSAGRLTEDQRLRLRQSRRFFTSWLEALGP